MDRGTVSIPSKNGNHAKRSLPVRGTFTQMHKSAQTKQRPKLRKRSMQFIASAYSSPLSNRIPDNSLTQKTYLSSQTGKIPEMVAINPLTVVGCQGGEAP